MTRDVAQDRKASNGIFKSLEVQRLVVAKPDQLQDREIERLSESEVEARLKGDGPNGKGSCEPIYKVIAYCSATVTHCLALDVRTRYRQAADTERWFRGLYCTVADA